MLEKPKEYKEIEAQQNNDTIYAEDINQIISNIELIKGGSSDEVPAGNIKELKADLTSEENARTQADTELDTKITENTNNLNTAINNEITNREEADTELQNNLEKEIQNRETEDDNIKNNIIGDLTTLDTTNKDSIVNAINHLTSKINGMFSGFTSMQIIDKAQYDNLSTDQKNQDIIYFVYNG